MQPVRHTIYIVIGLWPHWYRRIMDGKQCMKNGETETTAINCRLNGFENIMITSPRLIIIKIFVGQSDSLDILCRGIFDQTALFFYSYLLCEYNSSKQSKLFTFNEKAALKVRFFQSIIFKYVHVVDIISIVVKRREKRLTWRKKRQCIRIE